MRSRMRRQPRLSIGWTSVGSRNQMSQSLIPFKALVVLLADQLPALGMGHLEVVGSEGEEEEGDMENVEDGHV